MGRGAWRLAGGFARLGRSTGQQRSGAGEVELRERAGVTAGTKGLTGGPELSVAGREHALERAERGEATWAAWAGRGVKLGRSGVGFCWAAGFGWAGLGFLFLFVFYFLFQTKLNIFEFKFEFEFKPHSIK